MLAFVAALLAAPAPAYPHLDLRNEAVGLTVRVHLPDAKTGFYRGTRFDWAGVVGPVTLGTPDGNGRKVFVRWKDAHDPANHDDIVGPCEEFGMSRPLGYDEAKVGDTFLKIGVGALVKPQEEKYRFYHNYELKYPGEWQVSRGTREVEFRQQLLARSGYGYRYVKRVVLHDTLPQFTLDHELTNSGTKDIDTDVYNHNFFNVCTPANAGSETPEPVGPGYTLTFPFVPTAPEPKERWAEVVRLGGDRRLTFTKPLDTGSVYAELKGLGGTAADHRVTFQHQQSQVVLTVEGSLPVERYMLWAVRGCVCPEPFVRLAIKPGETKKWSVTYTFQGNRYLR